MNYASEFGEDRHLVQMFPGYFKQPKFYVDVGCGGPVVASNTHFLRCLGWSGLNIDGNPNWAPDWPPETFIHAVISTEPKVHFDAHYCKELSRITTDEPNVEAVTLESILQAHHVDQIGLLSVDCEGKEYEVIRSMDLELHKPEFIISEYNTHGVGEDFRVMEFLLTCGYEVIHQTVANLCYKRCSQPS